MYPPTSFHFQNVQRVVIMKGGDDEDKWEERIGLRMDSAGHFDSECIILQYMRIE